MISTIFKHISLPLSMSMGYCKGIMYGMSNRKSKEQLSYFNSRSTVYDTHKYPHYMPTLTIH